MNLLHIESRPSVRFPNRYEFMVDCAPSNELGIAIETLRENSSYFNIISRNHKDNRGESSKYFTSQCLDEKTSSGVTKVSLKSVHLFMET